MDEHKEFILVQALLSEVIALRAVVFIDAFRCHKESSCKLEYFTCEGGLDLMPLPEG
jgi:hypothetical protein